MGRDRSVSRSPRRRSPDGQRQGYAPRPQTSAKEMEQQVKVLVEKMQARDRVRFDAYAAKLFTRSPSRSPSPLKAKNIVKDDDDRNLRLQANLKKEEGKKLEPKREGAKKTKEEPAPASDSDSSSEKKKKKKKKEKKVVKDEPEDSDEWVELPIAPGSKTRMLAVLADDDDDEVGPQPMNSDKVLGQLGQKKGSYGGNLMPGEGDAMAGYVQSGERIPRRGEVGMTADQIDKFEDLGYVMSGSRHRRMNAVRIRKENQVYSAEEQRALALYISKRRP